MSVSSNCNNNFFLFKKVILNIENNKISSKFLESTKVNT